MNKLTITVFLLIFSINVSAEAQQNMESLSFSQCSELYYTDPSGETTNRIGIFYQATWVFSHDGRGKLMVLFNNGPVKIVAFNFYESELDDEVGLWIKSRRVTYEIFDNNSTTKTINRRCYAEILSDGANAIFTIYEKEGGNLVFAIKVHP
jgi:hypothetical protein